MYNKLFTKILDSSIWLEPTSTRIVWVTLLAAMDSDGYAHFSSIRNLAIRARVTDEEADAAIQCFLSPDPNSSNPEHDGRRVERVPGGFLILNAEEHRRIINREVQREQTRRRVHRYREKMREKREAKERADYVVDARVSRMAGRAKPAAPREGEGKPSARNGKPDPRRLVEIMRTVAFPNLPPHDSHETERNACELANSGLVSEESYREVCEFVAAHRGEKGVPVKPASVLQTDTVAGLLNRVHGAKDGSGDGMGRTVMELKELRESLKARLSALAEHMPLGNSAEAQEMREKWKREDANGIEYVETKKAVEDAERRIRETKP